MEQYWKDFLAVSQGLSIPRSLEIVVQDDGNVESRQEPRLRIKRDCRPSLAYRLSGFAWLSGYAETSPRQAPDKPFSKGRSKISDDCLWYPLTLTLSHAGEGE